MTKKIDWKLFAPVLQAFWSARGTAVQQSQVKWPAAILSIAGNPRRHLDHRIAHRHKQHAIGLTQAELSPDRDCRFRVVDDGIAGGSSEIDQFGRVCRHFACEDPSLLSAQRQS